MASETVGWHLKRIVPPENKPDSDILLNIIGKKVSIYQNIYESDFSSSMYVFW